MKTYKVTVTREGDAWLADVPSVQGAHTFARSLEGLATSASEVVRLMDDLPDDAEIDLDFTFDVDDELVRHAADVGRQRVALNLREAELREVTAGLVRDLRGQGYSVRDAARLLAMTPGRVSQLANSRS